MAMVNPVQRFSEPNWGKSGYRWTIKFSISWALLTCLLLWTFFLVVRAFSRQWPSILDQHVKSARYLIIFLVYVVGICVHFRLFLQRYLGVVQLDLGSRSLTARGLFGQKYDIGYKRIIGIVTSRLYASITLELYGRPRRLILAHFSEMGIFIENLLPKCQSLAQLRLPYDLVKYGNDGKPLNQQIFDEALIQIQRNRNQVQAESERRL
jgi:hypothetical protein